MKASIFFLVLFPHPRQIGPLGIKKSYWHMGERRVKNRVQALSSGLLKKGQFKSSLRATLA
jgi:hypothetical protein